MNNSKIDPKITTLGHNPLTVTAKLCKILTLRYLIEDIKDDLGLNQLIDYVERVREDKVRDKKAATLDYLNSVL